MNNYQEVSTQNEMDALMNTMHGFHDSMAKEIHILNRGAVLPDHAMLMSHQFDAQVLIQSQDEPFAIELLFIDVQALSITDAGDYFSAMGIVEQQSISINFDAIFKISSKQLFYRVQPEYLGLKARLTSEVPSPKAIAARSIDNTWRQCSSCSEAWEENPSQMYSVCPKCLSLTTIDV